METSNSDSDSNTSGASRKRPSTPKRKRMLRNELRKDEKQTTFNRKFRQQWKTVPAFQGWLDEIPNEPTKFKCKCCNLNLQLKGGQSEIRKHSETKKHKLSVNKLQNTSEINKIFENLSNKKKTEYEALKNVQSAEIKVSEFVARHNIAISIVDDLLSLFKEIASEDRIVQQMHLGRTKCTNIINHVLCPVQTEELIAILKDTYFSILVDESTDISSEKYLCILVTFVSRDGEVITKLLKLLKLDATDCSAEVIFNNFHNFMQKCELPFTNIIAMASDGANVMLGENNSFKTRLASCTDTLLILKCICHSSALIASKACKVLPSTSEDLMRAVSTYISSSGKRSAVLQEFQEYFKTEKKKMLKLSSTRWLCLYQCVERLLENWAVLKHFFLEASLTDNLKQTDFIRDCFHCEATKAYFLFLKYILNYFNAFNALFQSCDILIHLLLPESKRLFYKIGQNFLKREYLDIDINPKNPRHFLELSDIYLGPECEKHVVNLDANVRAQIKKKCLEFYIEATLQIQQRLPLKSDIFEEMSFINIEIALTKPRSENDLKYLKEKFKNCKINVDQVDVEWRNLLYHFTLEEQSALKKLSIPSFWHKLFDMKDFSDTYLFRNISSLAKLVLTLPHSNAESERIFSILSDVKNKKRNRLQSETLNAICVIRSGKKINKVTDKHFELMKTSLLYKK